MHSNRMHTAHSLPYVGEVSVQGGLCLSGSLSGGLCLGGLCPGVSVQGWGSLSGCEGSLSKGQGGLCPGGLCPGGSP